MFNDLFWALYWIDVLSHIVIVPLITMVAFLATVALVAIHNDAVTDYNGNLKHTCAFWSYKKMIGWIVPIVFAVMLVTQLIPSKQTMYLMLGVKGGEAVVNSEFGKKIGSIIEGQLDEYVEAFGKKKK